MLPGSSPCELRLLLPDNNIGKDGFHDVVVENLIGSSTWRSRHVNSLEHRVGGSPVYCMCMYVYIYIYIYIYNIYIYIYIYIICIYVYIYIYVCMYVYVFVCVYVYIYAYVCVCVCNYISYVTLWKISLFFKLTLGPPITQLSYGWPSVWYTLVLLYLILWCVNVCLVCHTEINLLSILSIVSPSDVIALRRRWPRAVFQVMKERCIELEDLRRKAFTGLQWAYRYAFPGYCPECKTRTENSLDSHMMCYHLGLGQLWRCPVEWCAMWKGSVRECRDHFNDKHSGSATLDFEEVSKSFPAWTVTREFWVQALKPEISGIAVDVRLFHESGRRLVHRYRVYRDPIPHPALREGRITKLLSFVYRAMVIAQLTHLRIAIPSSGNPPGEVPSDCFPTTTETSITNKPRRVTFSSVIQSTVGEMDLPTAVQDDTPTDRPMTSIMEEKEWPEAQEKTDVSIVPPPGFRGGHRLIGMILGMPRWTRDWILWQAGQHE